MKQQNLGGLSLVSAESGLRMSAHKIADYIYAKLLGGRGVFATRLSYVIQTGGRYQLQISDSDGQDAKMRSMFLLICCRRSRPPPGISAQPQPW